MLKFGTSRFRRGAIALAISLMMSTPAMAQGVYPESPNSALSRHIRVLATSPRDYNALLGAGRAALELGDIQSAAGFFSRAEEAYPTNPGPKIGLGAAMVQMSDPDGALFYFNQALRLGAAPISLALDRGTARDLMGDLGAAQTDYRLALSGPSADEARRRLALSLAIAKNRKAALEMIQPLLNRRDPATQRTRAFVLALTGDRIGAAQAIEAVMPGGAARFEPFFRFLPDLPIADKAAAVHLGVFPEDAARRVAMASQPAPVQVAQVQPQPAAPPRIAHAQPRPVSPPAPQSVRVAAVEPAAKTPVGGPAPSFSLPSAVSGPSTASATPLADLSATLSNIPPDAVAAAPEPLIETPVAESALASAEVPVADGARLSGIDKLLATITEVNPPASGPKAEKDDEPETAATRDAKSAEAKKTADKNKREKLAAEKKKRDEKLAADKRAKEEAAKLGVGGTNWVQLAGGSNQDRMSTEFKRLSGKAGSLLKSRSAYVTEGKDYFRLLVGPFDDKGDAQAFVNKLAKEGVDGFSWTRTPAKIKIEKLTAR